MPLPQPTQDITESAFSEIVAPHVPHMLRKARRILGSEDKAWDAVQETLLRVWTHDRLPPSPRGVLIHLVVKSCLHQLRCQERRSYHETLGASSTRICCQEDPLAHLEGSEREQAVREAIACLPTEFRVVVELYELQKKSYDVIASQLEVPVGTIRSRLSRGRTKLRASLSPDLLEDS